MNALLVIMYGCHFTKLWIRLDLNQPLQNWDHAPFVLAHG
jgi:hypothetical protein